mgnify:CR=1 FL=1
MREKLFHRDFTLVVIGQIISLLGNAVLRFVLPLYLLDVTGSRSLFGLCSAAAFVPMVVLTPLGGVVADRLHKQRIMVVLDFFTCALVALTALALGHLPLVPVLVAAMMLLYGISGAYQPAVQASMPLLCPPDRLGDGVTPVLAGASACFFASAVMELFIQIPHTPRHTGASVWQTARADLAESGTFLRQERPEILKYIALVSAFNLLLSALLVVSMPVLIKQTLVLGDTWYGLNQTAMAAGSLAGGLTAGLLGPRLTVRRSWLTLLACGVCLIPMGLCLLAGVGAVAAFAVLTAAGFVLMACAALFTVTMLAHIQAQTPATLVGKVVSLLLTVSLCAQPAGQALYGVLLEQLAGGEGWVLLGAACGAMIVAVAARRVAYSAASGSSRCMAETS